MIKYKDNPQTNDEVTRKKFQAGMALFRKSTAKKDFAYLKVTSLLCRRNLAPGSSLESASAEQRAWYEIGADGGVFSSSRSMRNF